MPRPHNRIYCSRQMRSQRAVRAYQEAEALVEKLLRTNRRLKETVEAIISRVELRFTHSHAENEAAASIERSDNEFRAGTSRNRESQHWRTSNRHETWTSWRHPAGAGSGYSRSHDTSLVKTKSTSTKDAAYARRAAAEHRTVISHQY